jgi:hypothetical protein
MNGQLLAALDYHSGRRPEAREPEWDWKGISTVFSVMITLYSLITLCAG